MRNRLGIGGLLVVVCCGRVSIERPGTSEVASGAGGVAGGTFSGGVGGLDIGGDGGSDGIAGSPLELAGASAGGAVARGSAGSSDDAGSSGDAGSSASAGASGSGGVVQQPHPYRALHIAVGALHSCALLEDHQLKCWGQNFYGQLGLGNIVDHGLTGMGDALPLVDLGAGTSVKAVAAGRYATCAILDDDRVKCWGQNIMASSSGIDQTSFALGDEAGEMGDALQPVPLGAGHHATKIGLGYYLGCIALEDDSFVCGGTSNEFGAVPAALGVSLLSLAGSTGMLGLYSDDWLRSIPAGTMNRPEQFQSDVVMVGAADECVGTWSSAKVLNISKYNDSYPVPQIYALAASQGCPVCAITGDHRVHCWEAEPHGGAQLDSDQSLLIPLPADAVELAGGSYSHLCALLTDGTVWCWDWGTGPSDPAVGGSREAPKQADLGIWRPR